ncbi:HK97 gp10 family phage protein [Savagea sp. SN6]|uniref:HK97 gp10 family phage protein n=2 Tax=Savagea serpentis TaxID=2785297 RepID=A0A8J7KGV0_9BACL|nr:HK97 gp10 family phage protein [Savagea serpentis]
MKEYTDEVEQGMKEAQEKVAKDGADKLKGSSPKRTGKYAKAWKAKEQEGGWVIYNTKGQLTHLLEKGHALRQGGRTRAFVHIEPVEQSVIDEFEKAVIKVIQNG